MMAGVGTNIAKRLRLLNIFLFKSPAHCNCTKFKQLWDRWGCKKCEDKKDVILKVLKARSQKYGYPFNEKVAVEIIELAILECFTQV